MVFDCTRFECVDCRVVCNFEKQIISVVGDKRVGIVDVYETFPEEEGEGEDAMEV